MTTVTIDLPETVFSALRLAPHEFVREMRIAAAVQPHASILMAKAAQAPALR